MTAKDSRLCLSISRSARRPINQLLSINALFVLGIVIVLRASHSFINSTAVYFIVTTIS